MHEDPSVGIQGGRGSIDLGLDEIASEDREGFRADIAKFFADLWGEPTTVLFEDEECDEVGRLQLKPQVARGPGHYLLKPKNGGNPYTSMSAPDSWELRECDVEWVPDAHQQKVAAWPPT